MNALYLLRTLENVERLLSDSAEAVGAFDESPEAYYALGQIEIIKAYVTAEVQKAKGAIAAERPTEEKEATQ